MIKCDINQGIVRWVIIKNGERDYVWVKYKLDILQWLFGFNGLFFGAIAIESMSIYPSIIQQINVWIIPLLKQNKVLLVSKEIL